MKRYLLLGFIFVGLVLAPASPAYVQYISKTGYPLRWSTEQVTFHVNMGCPENAPCWNDLVKQAVDEWNAVNSPFHITLIVGDAEAPDSCGKDDGWNTIRWSTVRCDGTPWAGSIAYTWISYAPHSGRINEIDLLFDQSRTWSAEFFYETALHELGHALGLDHPNEHGQEVRAVMNQNSSDDTLYTQLQRDDRHGIRGIYDTLWWDETDYPTELLGAWEFVHPEGGETVQFTLTHIREYTSELWAQGWQPTFAVSARRVDDPRGEHYNTHYLGAGAKESPTCLAMWLFYEGPEMFTGRIAVGTTKDESGRCTAWPATRHYDVELFRQ